jgi:16S rRNA (guanine527-N7)-methyltransferase
VPDTDPGTGTAFPAELRQIIHEAQEAGFVGSGPVAPHLRHAEGFVVLARRQAVPQKAGPPPRLLDLGSGGGLPGLVVALGWPEASLTLLEANQRRSAFLTAAVARLGLGDRVTVLQTRAEVAGREPGYRAGFDGVVVRSFGSPGVVAECAAPFLRPGGWAIVSEPPGATAGGSGAPGSHNPARWPTGPLRQFGLVPGDFVQLEAGYQILHQVEPCPDRFPRRDGMPAKKPLF